MNHLLCVFKATGKLETFFMETVHYWTCYSSAEQGLLRHRSVQSRAAGLVGVLGRQSVLEVSTLNEEFKRWTSVLILLLIWNASLSLAKPSVLLFPLQTAV